MGRVNDVVDSLRAVISPLIDRIPGARGTLVSSPDGHVFAAETPGDLDDDTIAAMAASAVGLAHRIVGLVGDEPAGWCHHRSSDAQAFVLPVDHYAVLTILSDETTRPELVRTVAVEAVDRLRQIFVEAD
jgi:predicted regulator of Ras-like GTPase activity (Roadblock/LC7/MglB family)